MSKTANGMAGVKASTEPLTSVAPTTESGSNVSWQEELRLAYRDPRALGSALGLPEECIQDALTVAGPFQLFAPRPYVSRMEPGCPDDPLLLQVWPHSHETFERDGFTRDPVLDEESLRLPGVIQKYEGRALLVMTGACAVHCRYCFRRHFPYSDVPHSLQNWLPVLEELAQDRSVRELILSGGDPLSLRDEVLLEFAEFVSKMPHLRRVRIHTRWPIVIPRRVTGDLLRVLANLPQPVVVIHSNHARELDQEVAEQIGRLRDVGCLVLNQAVLLRGINDGLDTLVALSERLIELRVVPYYLNELDRVAGSWHFEVSRERALALMEGLQARLPGYAIPRLVRDEPGRSSKRWIF